MQKNTLSQPVIQLSTCWKITLTNETIFDFTDNDLDLKIDNINYSAKTGFTASSVESHTSLTPDNLNMEGMLTLETINEHDILSGKYNGTMGQI